MTIKQIDNLIAEKIKQNSFQRTLIKEFFTRNARVNILWGERGCGKTYGVLLLFLKMLSIRGNLEGVFIRNSKAGFSTAFREIEDLTSSLIISSERDRGKDVLKFVGGSELMFKSVRTRRELRQKLKGQSKDIFILDEADEFKKDFLMEMLRGFRSRSGEESKIIMMTNPSDEGKEGAEFFRDVLSPWLTDEGYGKEEEKEKVYYLSVDEYGDISHGEERKKSGCFSVASFEGKTKDNKELCKQSEYVDTLTMTSKLESCRENQWLPKNISDGALEYGNIQYCTPEDLYSGEYVLGMGCDFAGGSRKGGESSISVLGFKAHNSQDVFNSMGKGALIDGIRKRMSFAESLKIIEDFREKYSIKVIVIEGVQMGIPILEVLSENSEFEVVLNSKHTVGILERIKELATELVDNQFFICDHVDNMEKHKISKEIRQFSLDSKKNNHSRSFRDDYIMGISHFLFQAKKYYGQFFRRGFILKKDKNNSSAQKKEKKEESRVIFIPAKSIWKRGAIFQ